MRALGQCYPEFSNQEEKNLKIAIPNFSERYKAHVEAERQYVSGHQQEISVPCNKRILHSSTPASSIEEAFRSVRSENRSGSKSSS